MGKKKTFKPEDEVDRLRREVRDQKGLIRTLLKRIKKLDRSFVESIDDDPVGGVYVPMEKCEIKPTESKCPKCSEGKLSTNCNIPGREITRCDSCKYRETKKI